MARRLFGGKPLSEPMLPYCRLDPKEHISQWNFIKNSKVFVQENALQHVVCEMAAILSRPQCVKDVFISHFLGCGTRILLVPVLKMTRCLRMPWASKGYPLVSLLSCHVVSPSVCRSLHIFHPNLVYKLHILFERNNFVVIIYLFVLRWKLMFYQGEGQENWVKVLV